MLCAANREYTVYICLISQINFILLYVSVVHRAQGRPGLEYCMLLFIPEQTGISTRGARVNMLCVIAWKAKQCALVHASVRRVHANDLQYIRMYMYMCCVCIVILYDLYTYVYMLCVCSMSV